MDFTETFKNVLTAIGGGVAVATIIIILLRNIAEKYIGSLIENSANKELEKAKNKLSRSMSAYELLLNKEFEYYQNIDKIYASLTVDVQDIYWNAVEAKNVEFEERCSSLKEISLRVIKTIPELKNFNLIYQCYVPTEVFLSTGKVVICLQNYLDNLNSNIHLFFDGEEVKESELKIFVDETLISISTSNYKIRTRLEKLSK